MHRWIFCSICTLVLLGACGPATIESGVSTAATAVSDPAVATAVADGANIVATEVGDQALNEAASAIADIAATLGNFDIDDVTLRQGEQLTIDASNEAANISNYTWTIQDAPAGAEAVEGQVLQEGSNGNLTLNPDDYTKYFPVAGDYTVRLTLTDAGGALTYNDFTITVP